MDYVLQHHHLQNILHLKLDQVFHYIQQIQFELQKNLNHHYHYNLMQMFLLHRLHHHQLHLD